MTKIAVVGTGAAGLTAAFLLRNKGELLVYEKENRFGGHVHTVPHTDSDGNTFHLDTGFMVFNDRTYPHLEKLFDMLGEIPIGPSDMSFGYYNETTGIQYAINFNPASPFAKEINLSETLPEDAKTVYKKIFNLFIQFSKQAIADLENGTLNDVLLGDYLKYRNVSDDLVNMYVVPMASAIWSTSVEDIFAFPAANLFTFFKNHGLISLGSVLNWKCVAGGAQTYVRRILDTIRPVSTLIEGDPVISITRDSDHVQIQTQSGRVDWVDYVVIATHADEVLPMLTDPSAEEHALFSAWAYQPNDAILHTDSSVMPPSKAAWASWNYRVETNRDSKSPLSVHYHLNRLQNHISSTPYFLSLNPAQPIDDTYILKRIHFTHPIYSANAIRSQALIQKLSGKDRTFYCGSYLGNGFHEDAVKSAFDVVDAGNPWQ
ncbi:hypothetical protein EBR96_05710 [bacterium]|nr:hypothetical protein [bacterium]